MTATTFRKDQRRTERARSLFRRNSQARLTMWEQLATLLVEFDLLTALDLIQKGHSQYGTVKNNPVALAAECWRPKLLGKEALGEIVKGWVTDRERLAIAVGQGKPNQAQIFHRLFESEQKIQRVRSEWLVGVLEPGGLLLMSWLMFIGMAYSDIYESRQLHEELRGYAKLAIQCCELIFYYISWSVPLALGMTALILWLLLTRWLSPARIRLEGHWPFSFYKRFKAAEFLQAYSILQMAREDSSSSLRAIAAAASRYVQWQVAAIEPLTRSHSIGYALVEAKRLFPAAEPIALFDIYSRGPRDSFPQKAVMVADFFSDTLIAEMVRHKNRSVFFTMVACGVMQILITLLLAANSISPSQGLH